MKLLLIQKQFLYHIWFLTHPSEPKFIINHTFQRSIIFKTIILKILSVCCEMEKLFPQWFWHRTENATVVVERKMRWPKIFENIPLGSFKAALKITIYSKIRSLINGLFSSMLPLEYWCSVEVMWPWFWTGGI